MLSKQVLINWDSLRPFGFNYLTREADSLGIRALVDLTAEGADIFAEFTGGCQSTRANYNSGAIHSVYIPNELIKPLLIFCLMRENNRRVILDCTPRAEYRAEGTRECLRIFEDHTGFTNSDHFADIRRIYDFRVIGLFSSAPRRGLSNVHAFSGRSQ